MSPQQAPLDQPGQVRDENAFDAARLLPYLRAQIPDLADGPVELRQFQGGASNLTYLLRIGDRELILRRPPAGAKAKSAHDMGREARVLAALAPHFPCPRPLAYCADESLIGSTFLVMEKLEGVILRRDLPQGLSYSPAQAQRLCLELFDTLIRLHTLDYAAIGLADFGRPQGYVGRQVKGWCERFGKAWTEDVPKCETIMDWLARNMPPDSPQPGLIHNDYRFDNVVLDPAHAQTIVGVLDWEMCTLGDPLMDLGSTLAYWVEPGDPPAMQLLRMQPSNIPGMLTREDVVRHYCAATGRELVDFDWYYVFGLFRLAVIAQQIYYRYKLGQTRNPRFASFGPMVAALAQVAQGVIDRRS